MPGLAPVWPGSLPEASWQGASELRVILVIFREVGLDDGSWSLRSQGKAKKKASWQGWP